MILGIGGDNAGEEEERRKFISHAKKEKRQDVTCGGRRSNSPNGQGYFRLLFLFFSPSLSTGIVNDREREEESP